MKRFVKCQRNGGDWYASYEGQSEETIVALLADLGCTDAVFLTQEEFEKEVN